MIGFGGSLHSMTEFFRILSELYFLFLVGFRAHINLQGIEEQQHLVE